MSGNKQIHNTWFGYMVFILVVSLAVPASAAVQDSDADGLTDEGEVSLYKTDPLLADTDGDGAPDGEEIIETTDPLNPEDTPLLVTPVTFKTSWYLGRASGIVAFLLFSASVIYGLLLSSTLAGKLRITSSYEFHRFLSWSGLLAVVVHVTSFFFDDFLRLTVPEALIPFLLKRPFPSALGYDLGVAVAFGVVALYLGILLAITAEFRARLLPRAWRYIHYAGFLFYVLMMVHGISSGTDSTEWWMQALYVASGTLVLALLLPRIFLRALPWWRMKLSRSNPASAPSENESSAETEHTGN